ncbi:MAG TPA: hypothetical protein VMT68_14170 [Caulobacteraceae bacterium]|nr:hypothetical protein [Caulobacteraceae bacterium]
MWTARPFDPSYAPRIVELAETQGLTRAELAKALGASERDFEAWAATRGDFAVALADADSLARAFWDTAASRALSTGEPFRIGIWAKLMAQRYGRSANRPREKADTAPKRRVRFNIPDNGRERKPGRRAG